MDLRKRLDDDLKAAMRAKDSVRLETVRNIRGAIRAREIDSGTELSQDEALKLIRGLLKQREESIAQYREGGRADLVERESAEKVILESYLPSAPDAAQVAAVVDAVVSELAATSLKDMGRVMKAALEKLGPAADGKAVSAAVKAKLGG
ncbi:MAG: GatB/YqeY domain-containing protein [Polyangiales bacterium]